MGVIAKRRVTVFASYNLSYEIVNSLKMGIFTGILRWEMTTAQSLPLIPSEVKPSLLIALKAYSKVQN